MIAYSFSRLAMALAITLLLPNCAVTPPAQASLPPVPSPRTVTNTQVFYEALAPYGTWIAHPTYGQVWSPRDVRPDWRPYTDGYWAHTNEYGWLWVENESWGWATFHYGRWAFDNATGWLWIPGTTWAPAWVVWRSGGGYSSWAPMPPNMIWPRSRTR